MRGIFVVLALLAGFSARRGAFGAYAIATGALAVLRWLPQDSDFTRSVWIPFQACLAPMLGWMIWDSLPRLDKRTRIALLGALGLVSVGVMGEFVWDLTLDSRGVGRVVQVREVWHLGTGVASAVGLGLGWVLRWDLDLEQRAGLALAANQGLVAGGWLLARDAGLRPASLAWRGLDWIGFFGAGLIYLRVDRKSVV